MLGSVSVSNVTRVTSTKRVNRKRKRGMTTSSIELLDMNNDVLYLILRFSTFAYNDVMKFNAVCRAFRFVSTSYFDFYKNLVHAEMGDMLNARCLVGLSVHDYDDTFEKMFKERYQYVPYLNRQPLMTVVCRSKCIMLLRNMAFTRGIRMWPSKNKVCYWLRIVAFHRSVSIFDRFCIGTETPLTEDMLRLVLCACGFLGFASNHTTEKGRFYLYQKLRSYNAGDPDYISRMSLVRTIGKVRSVLMKSNDPRVRSHECNHFIACPQLNYGFQSRYLFDKSILSHIDDFDLLSVVMSCLRLHRDIDESWFMCMYLLDIALQSELAFYPNKVELGHAIYLYAWHCFPRFGDNDVYHLYSLYRGVLETHARFRPLYDKLSVLRHEAKVYNKEIYRIYAKDFYSYVSMRAPDCKTTLIFLR